jgi:hypothetical protein
MLAQRRFEALRQHRYPVLKTFALPHHNLVLVEIDILNPQPREVEG